jgi:zinc transport system substrate-binding protein
MGNEIARVLAAHDPGNGARYQANAARLAQRLGALDQRLAQQFAGVDGSFAVFHDAYQYLERRYGLHSVGTVTSHPERRPGVAHLQALRDRLARDRVRCLFSEPQFQPRLVATLSEGLEIRHAVLDPLGTDIPPGPDAYEGTMQAIADRLTGCMEGGAKQ